MPPSSSHGSAAQIVLRWAVQRGTVVLPKSVNIGRVIENASIFDFELDEADNATIAKLDQDFHFLRPFDWFGVCGFMLLSGFMSGRSLSSDTAN